MTQSTVSLKLDVEDIVDIKSVLTTYGWFEEAVHNEYVALRMKNNNGSVVTLYTSKKIVFQGNEDFSDVVSMIKKGCERKEKGVLNPHIGVDEVGKGDYFGPLVVVGCYVSKEIEEKLLCLGVGDSKQFSDEKILKMYSALKDYPYYYPSIVSPLEYNTLYEKYRNASVLLAKQHSKVIEMGLEDLRSKDMDCSYVVIDQFSSRKSRVIDELGSLGSNIDFRQFHKGESDIAVATASIIARGLFLVGREKMKEEYYFDFPKGASDVISQAREFVKRYGSEELRKVAKISFKTTAKVLQSSF
jgi:ribonuclease HIII